MDRAFTLNNCSLRVRLVLARVAFNHLYSFDDRPLLGALHLNDLATLAFFGAGDNHYFIALFHMKFLHNLQMTSGAREMIFMNFLSRNSRATGPKMRVPRGFRSLSMMTIALPSKRR